MHKIIYFLVAALLFFTCTKDKLAGTVSDTDTGKSAMVYNPDFTPAVGATVKFFEINDTTRTPALRTSTDSKGRYSYKGLAKGTYNIIASDDSLLSYQDSAYVSTDTAYIHPDTLEKPGSVTAIVGVQPNDDPRTVTVQVLGTNIFSNVDENGKFTLAPLAKGTYNVRLITTLPNYTPTYTTLTARSSKNDTLQDTLWMTYTGIPVVLGLKVSYDTVNGVVSLYWGKNPYKDFQTYMIYRDMYGTVQPSSAAIAINNDTSFVDTIFKRNLSSGQFSFFDTNDYHYIYRVAIRNNSIEIGKPYKDVSIIAASPTKVTTTFLFTKYHLTKGFYTDSASINDSIRFAVYVNNPTRALRTLTWIDIASRRTILNKGLDTNSICCSDTLEYLWTNMGRQGLECSVKDMAGNIWKDTANVVIVSDPPLINISTTTPVVQPNDTIKLHLVGCDKYGNIVKWEMKTGDSETFMAISGKDTVLFAPNAPIDDFPIRIRATDDDGNTVEETISVRVRMFVCATSNHSFNQRFLHTSIIFDNKIWGIGGADAMGATSVNNHNDLWYSIDGIDWTQATAKANFPQRHYHTSVVFNNKMWVIGGDASNFWSDKNVKNDVWYSTDGIAWTQAPPNNVFSSRGGHTSAIFDNKIWVIGGYDSLSQLKNDVWYSTDGIDWTQATAQTNFSPRWGHTSVVFDNKIWVIGGSDTSLNQKNDVWYSTNGIDWTQATTQANFPPRHGHTSVVFDNKIWVIGGAAGSSGPSSYDTNIKNDVWYSINGIDWVKATAAADFSSRCGQTSGVFLNKIWVMGGLHDNTMDLNDVWYSNELK